MKTGTGNESHRYTQPWRNSQRNHEFIRKIYQRNVLCWFRRAGTRQEIIQNIRNVLSSFLLPHNEQFRTIGYLQVHELLCTMINCNGRFDMISKVYASKSKKLKIIVSVRKGREGRSRWEKKDDRCKGQRR